MADLERGAGCRADRCLISRGRSRRPWADAYEIPMRVAKFSCSAACKPCQAIVWVTAATQMDGSWQITHSLQWGE